MQITKDVKAGDKFKVTVPVYIDREFTADSRSAFEFPKGHVVEAADPPVDQVDELVFLRIKDDRARGGAIGIVFSAVEKV